MRVHCSLNEVFDRGKTRQPVASCVWRRAFDMHRLEQTTDQVRREVKEK